MTPQEKLETYHPKLLIVGYDDKMEFKSTVCQGREDFSVAIKNYKEFRLFWLKESKRENDYWRNKCEVFLKQKENVVSGTT